MKKVFPDRPLDVLPPEHPLFSSLHKIGSVSFTKAVRESRPDLTAPLLQGIEIGGSTRVIFSRYDLGNGWEGIDHPWARGLEPQDALRIGVNAVVYAMTH